MAANTRPTRKSRKKFHPKTRTGCETCLRRHVKCDEKFPCCTRCELSHFPCPGPRVIPRLDFVTGLNREELRALQFFRERTAKSLAGYHDLDFWSYTILRLSYRHGALQHFIAAISSLDELGRPGSCYAPFVSPQALYAFGLGQYVKAIESVRQNSRLGSIEFIASTVFCFLLEVWLGDLVAAQKHACAALRLLQPWRVRQMDQEAQEVLTLYFRPMILRMCPQFTACSTLYREVAQDLELQPALPPPANFMFETYEEAKRQFDSTSEFIFAAASSAMALWDGEDLKQQLLQLRSNLDCWYHRLCQLDYSLGQKPSGWSVDRHRLELRYRYYSIGLMTVPLQDEMLFDDFEVDFVAMVNASESILKHDSKANPGGATRSTDCSTMMALFFTVSSCREPSIRRRTLRLLYRFKRVDLIWNSLAVGILAEQIMMLEERTKDIKASSDVEAAHRVRATGLKYDSGFLTNMVQPPKMVVTYEQPHANNPGVQQLNLPFTKIWTGQEYVWSACTTQTPLLLEETRLYKMSRDAYEPEQRAVDFILPVNHDLDCFWRMQIMDLGFNDEFLRRFPEKIAPAPFPFTPVISGPGE